MDPEKLWQLISSQDVWLLTLLAAALGVVGGLGHFFAQPQSGTQSAPPPLEWWKQLLVGAVAAVAVLYVAKPETALGFISGSLVAGYAGLAIMAALESRTLAGIAEAKLNTNRADIQRAIKALETTDTSVTTAANALNHATVGLPPAAKETLLDLKTRYPQ